jgi:hypothetical protein
MSNKRSGKGKLPRAHITLMDDCRHDLINNLAVDAYAISRIRDLVNAGAYESVDEALRQAVKVLVVENASRIVRHYQHLGLRLVSDTISQA